MNKAELVSGIATDCDVSAASAHRMIDSLVNHVTKALQSGESVTLVGFGTFKTGKRSARTGRNPRTGEEIKIAAAITPRFSAGKALKDAVNSGGKKKAKK